MDALDRRMLLGATGLVGVAALSRLAKAGPLEPPPGPVAPTGKTLVEVEPRRNVNALAGSAEAVHVISEPGSYVLTANVVGQAGKHGILILASGVSLDLNGFELRAVPGVFDAIAGPADGSSRAVQVRGGVIRGTTTKTAEARWASGVAGQFNAEGWLIQDMLALFCADGFRGFKAVISNCIARDCFSGFNTNDSQIRGCTASDCFTGFDVNFGSIAVDCSTKFGGDGFRLGGGAAAERCFAHQAGAYGFMLRDRVRVSNCTAIECDVGIGTEPNFDSGIDSVVEDCVTGSCTAAGFKFDNVQPGAGRNLIVRNRAIRNTGGNYALAGTNRWGPVVALAASGDLSVVPAAAHPLANLSID